VNANQHPRGLRLSLPATSANLGPGFDAVGLALSMHLTVEAHAARAFSIHATGRDAELCGALENNLILDTYRHILASALQPVQPLSIKIHNEIPLGMGCGSSAAAIVAGIMLADHFGDLQMGDKNIVWAATQVEGHPDNVAACYYGGFTTSAQNQTVSATASMGVETATFPGDPSWEMLLAVPSASLATKTARALLPESYSKADAVFNVQRAALLTAAFAQGRPDLLRTAMQDRLHQPYRADACPLLKTLLPLTEEFEIAGVALSGAGPSVLLFLAPETSLLAAETRLATLLDPSVELLPLRIAGGTEKTVL
jgi:homoserine kinase